MPQATLGATAEQAPRAAPDRRDEGFRLREWIPLAALWLAHAAANYSWLKLDTYQPYWDMAGHVSRAIEIAQLPFSTDLVGALRDLFTIGPYPPLLYWLTAPLLALLWPTADVATGIIALYSGLLLLSVYGIGRHLGDRGVGLLAAAITSFYPILYGFSRLYMLDYPLTVLTALAIWLLIRSKSFERRGPALLCGVALGLGLLTKWTLAIYVGGPLLFAFVAILWGRSWRNLINLALAGLVAALLAGPWYWINRQDLVSFVRDPGVYRQTMSAAYGGLWYGLAQYIRTFLTDQVLLPFALLFALGLLLCLVKLRAPGVRTSALVPLLLGWLGAPLLFWAAYSTTDVRFTMPCLPMAALVTALGLWQIRPAWLRGGVLALTACYALWQFAGLTWGLSDRLPPGVLADRVEVHIGGEDIPVYAECGIHIVCSYQAEDWQAGRILGDLLLDANLPAEQMVQIAVVANVPGFEWQAFSYRALAEEWPVKVLDVLGAAGAPEAERLLLSSDYVLTKTGFLGPEWSLNGAETLRTRLAESQGALGEQFELVGLYALPGGETAKLYRRRSEGEGGRHSLSPIIEGAGQIPGMETRLFFSHA